MLVSFSCSSKSPISEAAYGDPEGSDPKICKHCSRVDVLKLEHVSDPPKSFVKTQIVGPTPKVSDPVGLG